KVRVAQHATSTGGRVAAGLLGVECRIVDNLDVTGVVEFDETHRWNPVRLDANLIAAHHHTVDAHDLHEAPIWVPVPCVCGVVEELGITPSGGRRGGWIWAA